MVCLAYSAEEDQSDNEPDSSSSAVDDLLSVEVGTTETTRTKRQSSWQMVSGPCLTGRGTLGKCTSFRLCYPYIKMPDFQFWDSWMVGMYDTCTYVSVDRKQVRILP